MRLALLTVLLLVACPSFAALDERIQVTIEEPVQGERYSGISNLRGWAVSPEGMGSYYLNVYIDGEFAFYMYPYGKRTDVGNAFPDYPDSDTGGFSMAFNYKDLSPGEHEIRVRAFDNAVNYNDAVTTFTTERFESSFIASDSDVDVSTSETWSIVDKQTYLVSGATLEGKQWDFLLKWDKASQSFKTEGIVPFSADNSASGSGSGSGSNSDSNSGSSGGSDTSDEPACASIGGTWTGGMDGLQQAVGGGYSVSDYYYLQRTFRIQQSECNITVTPLIDGYLPMSGSISGSSITVSGQPISKSAFKSEFEDYLYANGIIGTVNATSIRLQGVGTFYDGPGNLDGPRIFLQYAITVTGSVATSQGTFSFDYRDEGSGNIYP